MEPTGPEAPDSLRTPTDNIAVVLDYDEAFNRIRFTQFMSWPGGQCKFFILNYQPNGAYRMLSNLATDSQDLLGWIHRMRETGYTGERAPTRLAPTAKRSALSRPYGATGPMPSPTPRVPTAPTPSAASCGS